MRERSNVYQLATVSSYPSVYQLDAYKRWVYTIPMLSADEERTLSERLALKNDLKAAERLVMAHLRYVVKIARHYSGYGLSQADLIQEGNVGLMKAVKRFNPDKGARLVTFAMPWIKAEMYEFIIRNWRIVKIATTKIQRKLFFNLRKINNVLLHESPLASTGDLIKRAAHQLDLKREDVKKMLIRMRSTDLPIESGNREEDGVGRGVVLAEQDLPDRQELNPALLLAQHDDTYNRTKHLRDALATLDDRSRDIIEKRWLVRDDYKKSTLQELAILHGVSPERIRQLEKLAMQQLRLWMHERK